MYTDHKFHIATYCDNSGNTVIIPEYVIALLSSNQNNLNTGTVLLKHRQPAPPHHFKNRNYGDFKNLYEIF